MDPTYPSRRARAQLAEELELAAEHQQALDDASPHPYPDGFADGELPVVHHAANTGGGVALTIWRAKIGRRVRRPFVLASDNLAEGIYYVGTSIAQLLEGNGIPCDETVPGCTVLETIDK